MREVEIRLGTREELLKDFPKTYQIKNEDVDAHVIDWGSNFYDVTFQLGPYVAGLNNVEGRDPIERMLPRFIDELRAIQHAEGG